MNKHTPGPWRIDFGWSERHQHPSMGPHIVGSDDRSVIELCPGYFHSAEGQVNARLIAAAPELLEALIVWTEASLYVTGEMEEKVPILKRARTLAFNALKKAQGDA